MTPSRLSRIVLTCTALVSTIGASTVVSAAPGDAPDPSADRSVLEAAKTGESDSGWAPAHRSESVDHHTNRPLHRETISTRSDPVGDAYWLRGDIDVAGISAPSSGTVTAMVGVALFESPYSLSWRYGVTGPVWSIDTTGDFLTDYSIVMLNSNGFVSAGVQTAGGTYLCDAQVSWDGEARLYGASFPAACIGNPGVFVWRVGFLFEDFATGVDSFDSVPDIGWAGPVVNDAAIAPTPPPTDPTPPSAPPPTSPGSSAAGFQPLVPARLLDTRPGATTVDGRDSGAGTRTAGSTTELVVAGRGSVPADAAAVVLNVTAVDTRAAGYLTVFPCGSARPNASSVNFDAGQVVPNAVVTKLGPSGSVCLFAQSSTDVIVDVNGWFGAGQTYSPLEPARLLETRPGLQTIDGQFQGIGARTGGTTLELVATGRGGVPADAAAVVLNVTAVGAQADGFLTLHPCGSALPNASNLNFVSGQTVSNAVIARVGAGGKVCVYSPSALDLVVDVTGYFSSASSFSSIVPSRLLETRTGLATVDGRYNGVGALPPGTVTALTVAGRGVVPATASAAVLNVTAVGARAAGYITVFPCGTTMPTASNLNHMSGQTVPNAVVAKIGQNGQVCIFNQSATDLVVDVNGWF